MRSGDWGVVTRTPYRARAVIRRCGASGGNRSRSDSDSDSDSDSGNGNGSGSGSNPGPTLRNSVARFSAFSRFLPDVAPAPAPAPAGRSAAGADGAGTAARSAGDGRTGPRHSRPAVEKAVTKYSASALRLVSAGFVGPEQAMSRVRTSVQAAR
jgi:hypothetical protein